MSCVLCGERNAPFRLEGAGDLCLNCDREVKEENSSKKLSLELKIKKILSEE
jgi:hypothetical protein